MSTTSPLPLHDYHPIYQTHIAQWRTLRAAYLGGREWNGQQDTYDLGPLTIRTATPSKTGWWTGSLREHRYLWRHPREKDERYRVRLRASTYENVIRPIVTTVAATLAKACKTCELPPALEYLATDVDRALTDLAAFRLQRLIWAHVYPHIFVLLERPPGPPQPSRMHEIALGQRTYAKIIPPLDLLDWRWNEERREFDWILLAEDRPYERVPPDERMPEEQRGGKTRWTRLIQPGKWTRQKDGQTYATGETGVDWVPLVIQYGVGQDPECAEPLGIDTLSDAVDKAIERFNKESWLTELEMNQTFNQAVIKSDLPYDELEVAVGTNTYVLADAFAWVAPSIEPHKHIAASIDRDTQTIRQMLGVEMRGEQSQAEKSGIALQLEQQSMSSMFSGYAAAAESAERAIWRMAAVMEGADPDAVRVEYARDFSALEAQARFATIMEVLTNGGLDGMARAELQKQAFLAAHPDCEDDVRGAVFTEIDAGVKRAEEQRAAQVEALKAMAMERLASEASKGPMPESEGIDATEMPETEQGESALPSEPTALPDVVTNAGAADKAQDVALNGAQVASLVDIVKSVADGTLPRESAVAIISAAYPLTPEHADKIVGPAGTPAFEPTKPEPAFPFGGPPKAKEEPEDGKDAGKDEDDEAKPKGKVPPPFTKAAKGADDAE